MIKKMNNIKKPNIDCINALGNGANWIKCSITGQNCPFQRWCTNKHLFELLGTAANCSNYKKEK